MLDRSAIGAIRTTNIKGREYAEVNSRVLAFYEGCPGGAIVTQLVSVDGEMCVFKATVMDEQGQVIATGHAYELQSSSYINKTSYIENCETSAVGRALGFAGIGINGSICSAEELQNALNQQEKPRKAAKKPQRDYDRENELYFAKKRLTEAVKGACGRYGKDFNEYVTAIRNRADYDENDPDAINTIAEEVEQS